jgi:hypothetical protein
MIKKIRILVLIMSKKVFDFGTREDVFPFDVDVGGALC